MHVSFSPPTIIGSLAGDFAYGYLGDLAFTKKAHLIVDHPHPRGRAHDLLIASAKYGLEAICLPTQSIGFCQGVCISIAFPRRALVFIPFRRTARKSLWLL
ncbi:hypothetical protein OROHE_010154 [Orobanche hederae]